MALLRVSLWLCAYLFATTHRQSFVSAQGLDRLTNGFIVEFANVADEPGRVAVIQDVKAQVEQATGGSVQVAHKLDLRSSLFNGASFRISGSNPDGVSSASVRRQASQGATVDEVLENTLMQMPSIAAVYPNRLHSLQGSTKPISDLFAAQEGEHFLQPRQQAGSEGNSSSVIYPAEGTSLINPHILTGVDKLQAEGIGGQGIRIAIIDSGIDPSHPSLGAGYGPGFKVEGGFDFVGEDGTADDSPITTCANHGTATSSIAAGLPYKYGFVGVAPNATILHYKVFPCSGEATTDIGVNASLRAHEAGVDVINASIGSQGGWGDDLWTIIARRIMDNGTTYMIAAGNDGNRGAFLANALSSGFGVPSIGSVDNAYTTTLLADGSYTVDDGEPVPIKYAPGFPANWTFGTSETAPLQLFIPPSVNGCIPYPNVTYSNNSVVLLPRPVPGSPTCDQSARVKEAGIRKMLIYNYFDEVPTRPLPVTTTENYPFDWLDATANIDHALGVELASQLSSGKTVRVNFPWRPENDTRVPRVQQNFLTSGFMSNYSTWGPTYEAKIGTTFSAPGGNCIAAGGMIYGGFVVASGTSFSSPYAAGVAALLKQAHPDLTPDQIINRLATTAKPIQMQTNLRVTQDYLAMPFQQGSGLVDAYAAVRATTTFNVSELAFNDTTFIGPQSFEIFNAANESLTYEITNLAAPTLYSFNSGNMTVTPFNNDTAFAQNILPDTQATLDFSVNSTIAIEGGGSVVVTVTATPPLGLDASRLPLYSGFVSIRASDGFNYTIPYGGMASPLRDVPVLDTRPGQERTVLIGNLTDDSTERPGLGGSNLSSTFVIPKVTGNITTSTELWNVSLPGCEIKSTFGSRRAEVSLMQDGVSLGSILPIDRPKPLTDTTFLRDSPQPVLFYGKMADGTFVEGGPYRFRVRLLRVTGDATKAEDWDEVVTDPFELAYGPAGNSSLAARGSPRK
ncbi:hypothetical protein N0V93_002089 [Gnomoniopsis smithogilvyi]|uniref:Uncharacterized protein n=1 Tax=Gnomoniopsis smithogilvyi TaxID=1191159 RepID=A0A9W8Z2W6_9PEZI|nr:hypothetical protein N0V93_002089 [Gnomoniopsis smithogilvyi]